MIGFNDFTKLEIRIGTVVICERVPETDRLLRTVIDFGDCRKQVVAGFGFKIKPDTMVGKQVPVVVNIEPARIKGVKSEGVLLAVDADGEPFLLLPEKPVPNGSKVR